jgi:hypothetical protein
MLHKMFKIVLMLSFARSTVLKIFLRHPPLGEKREEEKINKIVKWFFAARFKAEEFIKVKVAAAAAVFGLWRGINLGHGGF